MKNKSGVLVAHRGVPRVFGPSFYASKQTIFATRISYILPKHSPIKVSTFSMRIRLVHNYCFYAFPCHGELQRVFYGATSWLQDSGVLQKMDNDIWMVYGTRSRDVIDNTGARVLTIQETLLPFIFCVIGLLTSLLTFLAEILFCRR